MTYTLTAWLKAASLVFAGGFPFVLIGLFEDAASKRD